RASQQEFLVGPTGREPSGEHWVMSTGPPSLIKGGIYFLFIFLPPSASAGASDVPAEKSLRVAGLVARLPMWAVESVVLRITSAVVSRISRGFSAWTFSASIVRSNISALLRVMLSRVDFFEASICVDRVLEMASNAPQKRLINA